MNETDLATVKDAIINIDLEKSDMDILIEQVELLFKEHRLPTDVRSEEDANRWLWVISKINSQIEDKVSEYERVVEEANLFYAHRIGQLQKQVDFFSGNIEGFVRANEKNLSLPNGKAGVRNGTHKEWADDEKLLQYSKDHGIDTIIKTTEKPSKKAIEAYVGEGESTVLKKTPKKTFHLKAQGYVKDFHLTANGDK